MIVFLVIDADDHADTVYHLHRDKQVALHHARQFADRSQKSYGDMSTYCHPCDGKNGWWFGEYGVRWRVSVREVELQ